MRQIRLYWHFVGCNCVLDPQTVMARQGYYLCYPPEKKQLPALQALRSWMLAEASCGTADRSLSA